VRAGGSAGGAAYAVVAFAEADAQVEVGDAVVAGGGFAGEAGGGEGQAEALVDLLALGGAAAGEDSAFALGAAVVASLEGDVHAVAAFAGCWCGGW
jgi:hypothetical protein